MEPQQEWPEPVVPVQSLSESCPAAIPDRYVKPPSQRPAAALSEADGVNIPLIDLGAIGSDEEEVMRKISEACREWGFFQVVNHGVSPELLRRTREVWRTFFHLPLQQKKVYANSPKTYEGYGSRLGTEKGAILDWGDYFFLHFLPLSLRDKNKWPGLPTHARDVIEEYGTQVVKLGGSLLKIFSKNLGLEEDYLRNAFGGEDVGACLRVNFYPTCPQPDLALGLSSHSDPGGLTLLLPDENVTGLQVRRGDAWVTVQPAQDSFIVNIGDQIQVLSNAIYKSVEHRVIVNANRERLSLAFFYNPLGHLMVGPATQLVTADRPALYKPMTFNDYRLFIRTKGPRGKSQVESLNNGATSSAGPPERG